MAGKDVGVAIEGLAEFRRALKSVSADLPKMLQKELKAAAESAAERARRRYVQNFKRTGGRRGAGGGKHTVDTIRATATQTSASVAFGGARFPWVAGQEFGSNKIRQFFPYTGRGPGNRGSWGRVIFPAVREEADDTAEDIAMRFKALAKRAYPEQP